MKMIIFSYFFLLLFLFASNTYADNFNECEECYRLSSLPANKLDPAGHLYKKILTSNPILWVANSNENVKIMAQKNHRLQCKTNLESTINDHPNKNNNYILLKYDFTIFYKNGNPIVTDAKIKVSLDKKKTGYMKKFENEVIHSKNKAVYKETSDDETYHDGIIKRDWYVFECDNNGFDMLTESGREDLNGNIIEAPQYVCYFGGIPLVGVDTITALPTDTGDIDFHKMEAKHYTATDKFPALQIPSDYQKKGFPINCKLTPIKE